MAAPAAFPRKLAALDTNVLFHLAEQYPPAHNLVLRILRSGIIPVVTATVVQELGYAADHGDHAQSQSAVSALTSMQGWGIQPVALKPVGNGICGICANVMANRGLLPEEEKNDAYILIEAAFWDAFMLITWDSHLLNASNSALNDVLKSFDLSPVQIAHPKVILGY